MKPNRSLRAFRRPLFAVSFLTALLYLLRPGSLLSAGAEDDSAKLFSRSEQVTKVYILSQFLSLQKKIEAGKFSEAIPIAQECLELCERALGPNDPGTAYALYSIGELYRLMGDYAKAEQHYQRALKIDERALGPDDPQTVRALSNLEELYRNTGDYAKAEALRQHTIKRSKPMSR